MPYITSNIFGPVHYRISGSGPAIALLHGFPGSGNLWHNIWPRLEKHHTVIVPDFPGSGSSLYTGNTLTVEMMAGCVNDILENEKIEKAVIAGHSMGGYVAMAFADAYPQRLSGISMVHSTAAADDDERKEIRNKTIALIRKNGRDAFINQMVPNLFSSYTKEQHPDIVAAQIETAKELTDNSIINFYTAMRDRKDRRLLLEKMTVPIQWIAGKDDNIIPPAKVMQQTNLSNVNFVEVYNNCGHMSMLEQPALLIENIFNFISYCSG